MGTVDVTFLQKEISAVKASVELQAKIIQAESSLDRDKLRRDTDAAHDHNQAMNDNISGEMARRLEVLEERMDARIRDIQTSLTNAGSAYQNELQLRDAHMRRELDLRGESFRAEQSTKEKLWDERFAGFLNAQTERDKRYELLAERTVKAAEGAEEAAKQAATVKSNYWAAVVVQLLAVVAILVGGYFANQANVLGAMQTTMAAMQAGKDQPSPPPESTKH